VAEVAEAAAAVGVLLVVGSARELVRPLAAAAVVAEEATPRWLQLPEPRGSAPMRPPVLLGLLRGLAPLVLLEVEVVADVAVAFVVGNKHEKPGVAGRDAAALVQRSKQPTLLAEQPLQGPLLQPLKTKAPCRTERIDQKSKIASQLCWLLPTLARELESSKNTLSATNRTNVMNLIPFRHYLAVARVAERVPFQSADCIVAMLEPSSWRHVHEPIHPRVAGTLQAAQQQIAEHYTLAKPPVELVAVASPCPYVRPPLWYRYLYGCLQ